MLEHTQDWVASGGAVCTPEPPWSFRDEERTVLLWALVPSPTRGDHLKTLNLNGLVMVDIRPSLLRIIVIDTWLRTTHRFQWLNLWGTVVPDQSKYHLSQDGKRVVVRLRKVNDSAGPWYSFLDVRTGHVHLESSRWPPILQEIQGAWRSEDEEPIEVLGDQVIWPQGSRDTLLVESDESFLLQQAGDAGKVPHSECRGYYQRQSYKICWEDEDTWSRIPGLALERKEAGREALPLQYDQQIARWLPWLPMQEQRRQSCQWLPSLSTEVSLIVQLAEDEETSKVKLSAELSLRRLKEELLQALEEEEVEEASDQKSPRGICLADADALPVNLLRRCRVCALSAEEAGLHQGLGSQQLAQTLLALRSGQAVSPANEAAALGGLSRWLQWMRTWIPPGSRTNIDAALDGLKERSLKASKEEQTVKVVHELGRWPPGWICHLVDSHQLLQDATERLMRELNNLKRTSPDGHQRFAEAKRRVAETELMAEIPPSRRRCDGLARRWVRRYAEEAARSLFTGSNGAARSFRQSLREGGICIVEDAVDWAVLLKSQAEVARLVCEELPVSGQSWLELSDAWLQDAGCQALSCCVALLQQLPWSLSDNCWVKGSAKAPGFRGCRWVSTGEVTLCQMPAGHTSSFGMDANSGNSLFVLLFLNAPRWCPEWGGALRCHDLGRSLSRDVWGDGGRLVVVEEATLSHQLLAASKPQTVLMLRLEPAVRQPPSRKPDERRLELPKAEDLVELAVCQEFQQKEQRTEETKPSVEMTSHEAIALFEQSLPTAFILD